jgi:hypothetical protein
MRDRKSDEHRRVATAKLGRPIKPGHDIDHRNENKADNSASNLEELPHSAHSSKTGMKANRSLRKLQASLRMPTTRTKLY